MSYIRVIWKDAPSEDTPIDAEHLNQMDEGIAKLDEEKLRSDGDIAQTTVTFGASGEESLPDLQSGSKTSALFAILAKAVSMLRIHLLDKVCHISEAERTKWSAASEAKHSHSNKTTLDSITAAYTTEEKNKLSGIAAGAQVNDLTGIKGNAESTYRKGNVNLTPANIGAVALSGGTMTGTLTVTVQNVMSSSIGGDTVNLCSNTLKVRPGSVTVSGGISTQVLSVSTINSLQYRPVVIGPSAPGDKTALWIDTST